MEEEAEEMEGCWYGEGWPKRAPTRSSQEAGTAGLAPLDDDPAPDPAPEDGEGRPTSVRPHCGVFVTKLCHAGACCGCLSPPGVRWFGLGPLCPGVALAEFRDSGRVRRALMDEDAPLLTPPPPPPLRGPRLLLPGAVPARRVVEPLLPPPSIPRPREPPSWVW